MISLNASLIILVAASSGMDGRMAALHPDDTRYKATVQGIEEWQQAGTTCEDPTLLGIISNVDSFEEPFEYWKAAASLVSGVRSVEFQYGFWYSDLALKTADAMVKRGCPEAADLIYRHILNTYTGRAYEAVRDRAKVGIDDVRALKGNASNP